MLLKKIYTPSHTFQKNIKNKKQNKKYTQIWKDKLKAAHWGDANGTRTAHTCNRSSFLLSVFSLLFISVRLFAKWALFLQGHIISDLTHESKTHISLFCEDRLQKCHHQWHAGTFFPHRSPENNFFVASLSNAAYFIWYCYIIWEILAASFLRSIFFFTGLHNFKVNLHYLQVVLYCTACQSIPAASLILFLHSKFVYNVCILHHRLKA